MLIRKTPWTGNIEDLFPANRKPSPPVEEVGLDDFMPAYPKERDDLVCPEPGCGAFMRLRSSEKHGPFYGCSRYPDCKGTHGAHPDGAPLGTPASKPVKELRNLAHKLFDRIWSNGPLSRSEAYEWMADVLDLPPFQAHIGMLDEVGCMKLIGAIRKDFPQALDYWDRIALGDD